MLDFFGLGITVAAVYGYAFLWAALLLRGRLQAGVTRGAALLTLGFPLFIQSEAVFLRAMAEVLCLDLCLKIFDYGRHFEKSPERRSLREFAYLAMPFPLFQSVLEDKQRLPRLDYSIGNLGRILLGGAGIGVGFAAIFYVNTWELLHRSFLLEHVIKVAIFIFTVESGSRCVFGLERLAGFDTKPLIRNVFLSLTVAEFWLRWNNRVHRWLNYNLFVPAARRFGRVGGVAAVFGFSGLFHEIAFDIATGRGYGYQLGFFALQTPLVLLSEPISRAIRAGNLYVAVLSYAATVTYLTVTSMFFLYGVDQVFPFVYVGRTWLP